MSPPPALIVPPAPPEPAELTQHRRWLFTVAFAGAVLVGALAGLLSARAL